MSTTRRALLGFVAGLPLALKALAVEQPAARVNPWLVDWKFSEFGLDCPSVLDDRAVRPTPPWAK